MAPCRRAPSTRRKSPKFLFPLLMFGPQPAQQPPWADTTTKGRGRRTGTTILYQTKPALRVAVVAS